jgi:hypothetical protein
MKNDINELREIMFKQLERLNKDNLNDEELKLEIDRGKSIADIGKVIVESVKTEILYAKLTGKPVDPGKFMGEQPPPAPRKLTPVSSVPAPKKFDEGDEEMGDGLADDKMGIGAGSVARPPDYSTRKIK